MLSFIQSAERDNFDSTFTGNTQPVTSVDVTHTPAGEIEMKKVINRLTELSDALQTVSLYTEAEIVRAHIVRLSNISDETDDQNTDAESVLSEFIHEFETM